MTKRKRISKLPKNDIQTTKDWAKEPYKNQGLTQLFQNVV
jgi:hypothetical protein